MNFSSSFNNSGSAYKMAVQRPENCTSQENCNWICSRFIINGRIQLDALALGGEPQETVTIDSGLRDLNFDSFGTNSTSRLLRERALEEDGSWDPEEGNAGVTITVEEDPSGYGAETETDSAGKLFVGMIGLIMVYATMIIA